MPVIVFFDEMDSIFRSETELNQVFLNGNYDVLLAMSCSVSLSLLASSPTGSPGKTRNMKEVEGEHEHERDECLEGLAKHVST